MKFCLQVTHSANLQHKFRSTHEDNLSSYESYKVIESLGHNACSALFYCEDVRERPIYDVVLILGALIFYTRVTHLHIAVPTKTRSLCYA